MLQKTNGIVLRSVKYGETSLIVTLFTADFGIQAYMVQGVRSTKASRSKSSYFQPATLLDMVVYMQTNKNMQRIREFQASYIYTSVQEDVVKNSIVLFSSEFMLRLLPEHAPLPELFEFAQRYFISLDTLSTKEVANFPLYFMIQCSRLLGYEPKGAYSEATPHLDREEGGFSSHTPAVPPYTTYDDAHALYALLIAETYEAVTAVQMNSEMRLRLIDWYIAFLQQYAQHLGNIRSLQVLRTILHM